MRRRVEDGLDRPLEARRGVQQAAAGDGALAETSCGAPRPSSGWRGSSSPRGSPAECGGATGREVAGDELDLGQNGAELHVAFSRSSGSGSSSLQGMSASHSTAVPWPPRRRRSRCRPTPRSGRARRSCPMRRHLIRVGLAHRAARREVAPAHLGRHLAIGADLVDVGEGRAHGRRASRADPRRRRRCSANGVSNGRAPGARRCVRAARAIACAPRGTRSRSSPRLTRESSSTCE